jgi:hypothetical protein
MRCKSKIGHLPAVTRRNFSRNKTKVTVLQTLSRITWTRIALKNNNFEGNHGSKTRYAAAL